MTTLHELKKRAGLTNAAIAQQLHCSASKVSGIIQGRYLNSTDLEIDQLAYVLGVTFERCWSAMCESYNELMNTPNCPHERYSERMAEVQLLLHEKGFPVSVEKPRELASIESSLVVPENRRLQ